jgi:hypothetical protein
MTGPPTFGPVRNSTALAWGLFLCLAVFASCLGTK